jgi:hypothetical protein
MKFLVLTVVALSLSSAAIAQRHPGQYWSLGGYGNILFPGTGHAPATPPPPGGVTGAYFSQWLAPSRRATDPQPSTVIVPSPVYDGYTADPSGNDPEGNLGLTPVTQSVPAPQVMIQSLVPTQRPVQTGAFNPKDEAATCVNYRGDAVRPQAAEVNRPTIYLIAFKDHSIVQALGYWLEAGTLHYVSAEYAVNQVSVGLIDRDLSQRLNDERGITFKLPVAK